MGDRAKASPEVERRILVDSRRRCCLCAYLEGDWAEKQGQLAHVDRDPSKSDFDAFAFLCLAHHDRYDGVPGQSKGYRPDELRHHRDLLYQQIRESGLPPVSSIAMPHVEVVGVNEHTGDRDCFAEVRLRNVSNTAGYVTRVLLRAVHREYVSEQQHSIRGNSDLKRIILPYVGSADRAAIEGCPEFEVTVQDLERRSVKRVPGSLTRGEPTR